MKTVLVTGATGNVSSLVIQNLKNKDVKIRALVRNAAKAQALKGPNVELVEGDLEKPKSLTKAFEGAETVWILSPPGPRAPEQSSNALWAARKGGAKHVVRMSAFGAAHDAPTINSRMHALSDTELEKSGLPFTILKPNFFMQNLLGSAQQVAKDGALYYPLGDAKVGMIDVRDIADAAAGVLTSSGHEGKRYDLTGPRSISIGDVAAALSKATGRQVKYVPVPAEAALSAMQQMGMDEWMLQAMSDYFAAYASGWGDISNDNVKKLSGHEARSIEDFARDFAGAFGKK